MIIQCPHCRRKFDVLDKYKYKQAKCPNCANTFLIGTEDNKPRTLETKDVTKGIKESVGKSTEATINDRKNPDSLLQVVSFLVPLVGFILGIVFVTKPSQVDKNTGKHCLFCSLAGLIACGIIFAMWIDRINENIDLTTAEFERNIIRTTTELEREIQSIETTCIICDGRGQTDCPICVNGLMTNAVTGSKETCSFCNGKGITTCTFCNGTGKQK